MDTAAGDADLSFDQLLELERRAAERQGGGEAGGGDGGDGEAGGDGDDRDSIVLPWWQHPVNIVTLVFTAAIVAAMIGWMVGDAGAEIEHNEVDVGFLQDMRVHHEQAVLMGFIYRGLPDTDPGLRTLAAGIVRGQSLEVGRMIQLLRSFGEAEANETGTAMAWMGMSHDLDHMPGMASEDELDRLGRAAGADADRAFVELMTEHHRSGISMASYAAEHAANAEVRKMAAAMAHGQQEEIVELAGELD